MKLPVLRNRNSLKPTANLYRIALLQVFFCSHPHFIRFLTTQPVSSMQLHLVFPPPMRGHQVLKLLLVLLAR
jgi:hypothetical protein